jgi:acetyltransferase-like isoleucine patch superfamily enzyme
MMLDLRAGIDRLARRQTIVRAAREPAAVAQALKAQLYLRRSQALPLSVRVVGRVRTEVHGDGVLIFGERCVVRGTLLRSEFVVYGGGRIEIGEMTFINYGVSLTARRLVQIGKQCHIGPFVTVSDNDEHSIEDKYLLPPSSAVIIEDRVWLGAKATVLKGVRIGHDAVVGAGAVVTRDVPPRSIVTGVPARVIRAF